jgi:hypothetical protein
VSFDNSRSTFNPFNNYASVVMPQGRVQLDADWNEFLAEIARRIQAGTLDTVGRAVYPATTPNAFYISASSTPWLVDIGLGRMYVDGLLAENHGPIGSALWDPALAELSGSPQPAPPSISGTPSIPFNQQIPSYFPGATLPSAAGDYLFYLDVWTRAVTSLQDPSLIDPAVGIDTSGRLQTVWQVRWMPAKSPNGSTPAITCGTPDASIPYPALSTGQLTNNVVPNTSTGDCCLTAGSAYTGLENQFYRVEIHHGGPQGKATFKWSRENASVATGVNNISLQANAKGATVSVLSVVSLGRDQVLNFSNGDWIELLDDAMEFDGQPDPCYPAAKPIPYGSPGILCQIDHVEASTNSIFLTAQLPSSAPTPSATLHTRIRRWDQSGTVYSTDINGNLTATSTTLAVGSSGDIPVPKPGTTLVLESGLTVSFPNASATYLSGDFWTFSARTDGSYDKLAAAPPRGIHHHYTKLSVVTFDSTGKATSTPDCRTPWDSSDDGDCGCCTVTVGDNQTSFGTYTSIQQAIDNLPDAGGEVCILPGQYYESVVLDNRNDVTLRGAGPQTVLHAVSANPNGATDQSGSKVTITTVSGINAIVTVTNSSHIELTGFTVEAPDAMACILLDQITPASQSSFQNAVQADVAATTAAASTSASTKAKANKRAATQLKQKSPLMVEQQSPYVMSSAATSATDEVFTKQTPYKIPPYGYAQKDPYPTPQFLASGTDVTLTDLVLTASTRPAIVAVQATLLHIASNRILMKDVAGRWPSVYVSGSQIVLEDNYIGLQDNADAQSFAPSTVVVDLSSNFSQTAATPPLANGGLQIGGYSNGVTVRANIFEGGAFNAISLGSILVNPGSTPLSTLNGLFFTSPVTSTGTTLVLPSAFINSVLAADGPLQNISIQQNRISGFGLCAVGPVGIFASTNEVVSVANLSILGNTILGTVQAPITPLTSSHNDSWGYAALCLPDLQGLTVRDNTITGFGPYAGAQVGGIFVLNAEQVDISRNTITETRDWVAIPATAAAIGGVCAGIAVPMVSPPALNQVATAPAWTGSNAQNAFSIGKPPIYQPGLPALRIEQNVVRVALSYSLYAIGYGPFEITGNQLSSGGTVAAPKAFAPSLNVSILNLGRAVEFDTPTSYSQLWVNNIAPTLPAVDTNLSDSSSGVVRFAHNTCQVETRATGATGLAAVLIFTMDHLNFSNNLTWIDGGPSAIMDAFLFGVSVQAIGNRFQESVGSVLFSALTTGLINVTSQNISTFCLYSQPNTAPYGANSNNLTPTNIKICANIGRELGLGGSALSGAGNTYNSYATAVPMEADINTTDYAMNDVTEDPADKINASLTHADTVTATRVQNLSLVQQARLTQVNRTATVIAAQAPAGSAQVKAANSAVTATQASVVRVAMLQRQVGIQAPAVTATGWALYGTVYNSSNAPVSAYSVYFVDSTNTYQNTFGIAYTGSDGSYQIVYAGPPAGTAAPTTPLFVQVGNGSGDPVYTSKTAFTPTPGVATYQVITLPAGEKPLGVLPIVLKPVILPIRDTNLKATAAPVAATPTTSGQTMSTAAPTMTSAAAPTTTSTSAAAPTTTTTSAAAPTATTTTKQPIEVAVGQVPVEKAPAPVEVVAKPTETAKPVDVEPSDEGSSQTM